MKKTVTVNLNGRVFTMDEDAYQLLDAYLQNLRLYFKKEEGSDEIISDFEARIEELLSERLRLGYEVISIKEVEDVIARVGQPDELFDENQEKEEPQAAYQKTNEVRGKKKFFRNLDDKMFGGVFSGVAAYFGWDVLPIRIIAVILIFISQFIIVPFYLLVWIIFPSAKTAEDKLRMQGKPITVENIGKTVAADKEVPTGNQGCLGGFLDIFVGFLKVCLIGLALLIAVPALFFLFIAFIVLIAFLFAGAGVGAAAIPFTWLASPFPFLTGNPAMMSLAVIILIGLPVIAVIYTIIAHLANFKPLHKSIKWICLVIWILALVGFFKAMSSDSKPLISGWGWNWKWSVTPGDSYIEGNGVFSEKECVIAEPVDAIVFRDGLLGNVQIEQISGDSTFILMSGDENLINNIRYKQTGGNLALFSADNVRITSDDNLIVRIQTPRLERIKSNMWGNVMIKTPFNADLLDVKLSGAGKFQADSLNVGVLKIEAEGIGSTTVSGKARRAELKLDGAGKIIAHELRTDTVFATVDGVGSIHCDPVKHLKAKVNGIGKITHKSDPQSIKTTRIGLGKIEKGEW